MNIFLLGYMASGKSTIGRQLAAALEYDFIDFDNYIVQREGITIAQIFKKKGEIYFRKIENQYLKTLVKEIQGKSIVALGGGTPCYGNNMELIQKVEATSIYLNVPFQEIANRLWQERADRPLVAGITDYDVLVDYVRKHLFERGFYYNQADTVLKITNQTSQEITEEIIAQLF